jgi:hypothetical protein
MKLGPQEIKLNWPLFCAWWSGLWGGLMIGFLAGIWCSGSRWTEMWLRFLVLPGIVFIAFLPRTILQFCEGVKRFRAAARRQPHL